MTSKAKVIVTASCGFEPGKTVDYKPLVDAAIKWLPINR